MVKSVQNNIQTLSANELGYVGLPREAVLDNTATPAEQEAFKLMTLISAAIPAAIFAPAYTLIGGTVILASCGSPGTAEDPILTASMVGGDGGTTDEGDTFVTADSGSPQSNDGDGDTLAATDDGMTLADGIVQDIEDAQDAVTDDTTTANDGDALATADDGGMSANEVDVDDGKTWVDSDDVATPPQDIAQEVQDISQDMGIETDVAVPVDTDVADTEGDGASDAAIPLDDGVSPQADAALDALEAGTDAVVNDEIADAAVPADSVDAQPDVLPADTAPDAGVCNAKPTCTISGSNNIAVNLGDEATITYLMSGQAYLCQGDPSIPLPIDPTPVSFTTKPKQSGPTSFNCTVFTCDGNLSQDCPEGNVTVAIPPPPVLSNAALTNPYPSGDGNFKNGNSLQASWSASASNNNPLLCTATLKDLLTNKDVASVQVSQAPSKNMSADIPIQNCNILPLHDYALSVFCVDFAGQKISITSNPILTYYKETLLFHRFPDGAGTTVTDSGPLQLNGKVVMGTPQWLGDGGFHFDGKTMISIPKPAIFKSLDVVSMLIVFKPTIIPQTNASSVMAAASSNAEVDSWGMEIGSYYYPKFLTTHNNGPVGNAMSPNKLSADTTYSFLGIQQSGVGTSLNEWDGSKWLLSASNQNYLGAFISGDDGDISIGCWNNGTLCYTGDLYQVAIIGENIISECK